MLRRWLGGAVMSSGRVGEPQREREPSDSGNAACQLWDCQGGDEPIIPLLVGGMNGVVLRAHAKCWRRAWDEQESSDD